MAEGSSCYSSRSRNYHDREKEKYKDRKQESPRKKYNPHYDRSHKESTSKEYERKYEERSARQSSRHWEDRPVNHRSDEKNRNSSSPSQRYNDHDDYDLRSSSHHSSRSRVSQHRSSRDADRYDDGSADDVRFDSYNNHKFDYTQDSERESYLGRNPDAFNGPDLYFNEENESLRHRVNNVSNRVHGSSNSEVTIIFRNKELEQRFLPTLEELVSELISRNIELEELQAFLDTKRNSADDDLPEGDLFALDNSTIEPNESASVPCYETSFSEVLQDQDQMAQANDKAKNTRPKRAQSCFNCSEDHVFYKCPYQIDHRRVAMAKKERQNSFPTNVLSNKRYHVQGMQESDFKPGNISEELRTALSLRPDQIPLYIYHMRVLNYPPGWLEEAEVETSGITLYGTDAKTDENNIKKDPNFRDEVQYDPDKLIDFPGFNVPLPPQFIDEADKLRLPSMQECHLRSYVEQFMSKVENTIPKRKRKLSLFDDKPSKVQRLEEDMDMDESFNNGSIEFNPPLPDENPPPPPPEDELPPLPDDELPPLPPDDQLPPLPPSDESLSSVPKDDLPSDEIVITISSDDESGTDTPMSDSLMEALAPVVQRFQMTENTPSLKDLEEIKKRLEMELGRSDESSNDFSNPCFSPDNSNDVSSNCSLTSEGQLPSRQISKTESCTEAASRQVSMTESLAESFSEVQTSSMKLNRTDSQRSGSKLVTLGTPSLSRHSSFKSLPKYENFSKDVTDHLNFENLPNSTGTYAKMKKVIKKVKEKINSFMQ